MFLVLTFALAVIHRYGPSREAALWRWITWGSALAAAVAGRLGSVLLVCSQLWQFQRNIWFAGRRHRLHDMALDLRDRHFAWGGD